MSGSLGWVVSAAGGVLVLVALRDLGRWGTGRTSATVTPEASVPAMFSVALDLADEAGRSADPDLRYAGRLLEVSAEDYLRVIDRLFLGSSGSIREICAAYAGDHRHEAATAP